MSGTADTELIARSRAGHASAFGQLVERYQRLVRAAALGATGDLAISEEIAQEAFVTAWTRLHELREPERFASWVCGIARNLARHARRHQTRHAPAASEPAERLAELAMDAPSPLDRAIGAQEERLLRDALRQIPESYREPLVLFYAEDHSIAEVAGFLGLSRDTVKQRLSRGRKYLRAGMREALVRTLARPAGVGAAVLAMIASLPGARAAAGAGLGGLAAQSTTLGSVFGGLVAASLTLAAVLAVELPAPDPRVDLATIAPSAHAPELRIPVVPVVAEDAPAQATSPALLVQPAPAIEPRTEIEFAPVAVRAPIRRATPRPKTATHVPDDGTPAPLLAIEEPTTEPMLIAAPSVLEHGPASVARVPVDGPALSFLDALGTRDERPSSASLIESGALPIDPPDMTARILETAL